MDTETKDGVPPAELMWHKATILSSPTHLTVVHTATTEAASVDMAQAPTYARTIGGMTPKSDAFSNSNGPASIVPAKVPDHRGIKTSATRARATAGSVSARAAPTEARSALRF